MQFGSQDWRVFRMIGYYRLWEAMALQPVDELSDEGGVQPNIPKPKGKARVSKPKSSPKKTAPGSSTPPKSSPSKPKPQKRPAKADRPSEAPKAKATPAMKRPAAAASPSKPKKVKVAKGFYQRDNKYGFKVDGREVFYVAWLKDPFISRNGKVFQFQILNSNPRVATKLKGRDGLSSETLETIAATWRFVYSFRTRNIRKVLSS